MYYLLLNDSHIDLAISPYLNYQNNAVKRIIKYIKPRLKVIKKAKDYVVINQSNYIPKLHWNKSDTDLLELIVALHESGAIQNSSKDLSQKEAIEFFSEVFQKDIKDPYKKLNSARLRYKDNFIEKLSDVLGEYYKKQNEKMK